MKSPITTHVLDTARGKPAVGVAVKLEQWVDGVWDLLGSGITDDDGRVTDLLAAGTVLSQGSYRISFETGPYFKALGIEGFYPYVPIVFDLQYPAEHYHVPLLLNPFGYSTYRGS